jgi:acetylornithine deacetylase/succinyl-diaminopimelate desuccinylase-like protein
LSADHTEELDALIHEAADWLRIPSISAGARNEAALREAAVWAQRRVLAAGGTCELVDTPGGAPLVVGELRARLEDAPTVLIYGHYDVQDPGDESAWTSPPFEPEIRDGRLYARGACDDKGNFLPLLHVACALADAGELRVDVRVLIEGGEETGATDVNDWVAADERGADCAIVFDAGMLDPETPALTVATRGTVFAHLTVRTGERPAHSGMYGGAALNALHALHAVLAAVLPGPDGRIPEALRQGAVPPTEEERAAWSALPDGATVIAEAGAVPADERAAAEYYERTTADASLDVHRIAGGETRTIVPPEVQCDLSVRLAPGQDPATIDATLQDLLRGALPAGAELELRTGLAAPSRFDPAAPALRIARAALARACGREPALIRTGGTLPILAGFAERGIPAIVSGFGLPQDNFHAPDESFSLNGLELGRRSAHALYEDLGAGLARGA